MTGRYLITTDRWFVAPDGKSYNSVWGNVQVLEDSLLGVKTNRNSTNWYAQIGGNGKEIIVAGCQIHYAIRCEAAPNIEHVEDWSVDAGQYFSYTRPTKIYIAE
jgi:hypothetical protein